MPAKQILIVEDDAGLRRLVDTHENPRTCLTEKR